MDISKPVTAQLIYTILYYVHNYNIRILYTQIFVAKEISMLITSNCLRYRICEIHICDDIRNIIIN